MLINFRLDFLNGFFLRVGESKSLKINLLTKLSVFISKVKSLWLSNRLALGFLILIGVNVIWSISKSSLSIINKSQLIIVLRVIWKVFC